MDCSWITWVVALLNYLDRQMLSTMQAAMAVDIAELSIAENFGRLMGIFLLVYGFLSPAAGAVADRMNRKWLIAGSLFVWSAVTFFMGYATSFNQLYWLRAFMGISEALYLPAALSMIAEYHTNKTRSLAIGIHMTGLYTGQALGGFGAAIAANYSWRTVFHGFGIIGIIYAVILILFLNDQKSHTSRNIRDTTFKHKSRKRTFLETIRCAFKYSIFLGYAILLYRPESSRMEQLKIGSHIIYKKPGHSHDNSRTNGHDSIAVASLIGVFIGGPLSDRWVLKNIKGRIYTSAIGLTLTVPSLILLGFGHTYISLICSAFLFGIGYGMFDANNMPILCQIISPKYRATAYGIMNMMGVFGGYAITIVLGTSTDKGNLGSILANWLLVLLAVIMVLLFLKPKKNIPIRKKIIFN